MTTATCGGRRPLTSRNRMQSPARLRSAALCARAAACGSLHRAWRVVGATDRWRTAAVPPGAAHGLNAEGDPRAAGDGHRRLCRTARQGQPHTHTPTHARTRTHSHALRQAHTRTQTHTNTHTHTDAHTCVSARTHVRARIRRAATSPTCTMTIGSTRLPISRQALPPCPSARCHTHVPPSADYL